MITVELSNLLFHAFHGIYEEEKILGNEYVVNVSVAFVEKDTVIEHIQDTVNYAVIYNIIKKRMSIATPLLETIAMQTGNEIYTIYPHLKSISISIKKMHPPIEGMQGAAAVNWQKDY